MQPRLSESAEKREEEHSSQGTDFAWEDEHSTKGYCWHSSTLQSSGTVWRDYWSQTYQEACFSTCSSDPLLGLFVDSTSLDSQLLSPGAILTPVLSLSYDDHCLCIHSVHHFLCFLHLSSWKRSTACSVLAHSKLSIAVCVTNRSWKCLNQRSPWPSSVSSQHFTELLMTSRVFFTSLPIETI